MADIPSAVDCVLREEDATLSGVITDTRGDAGGKTRFGIASRFHPELVACGFYSSMARAEALALAEETMTKQYASPLQIGAIEDQVLATKFLSFGVNAGVQKAVLCMQYAVNHLLCDTTDLQADGICGPQTVAEINRCFARSLLNSFRLRMIGYYVSICRANSSQRVFLCGWIDRALT